MGGNHIRCDSGVRGARSKEQGAGFFAGFLYGRWRLEDLLFWNYLALHEHLECLIATARGNEADGALDERKLRRRDATDRMNAHAAVRKMACAERYSPDPAHALRDGPRPHGQPNRAGPHASGRWGVERRLVGPRIAGWRLRGRHARYGA